MTSLPIVHYVHATNLQQLRTNVELAVQGLMLREETGRSTLEGRPFKAKLADFPTLSERLNAGERQFYHMTGLWVQTVVYYID